MISDILRVGSLFERWRMQFEYNSNDHERFRIFHHQIPESLINLDYCLFPLFLSQDRIVLYNQLTNNYSQQRRIPGCNQPICSYKKKWKHITR
jgi:hypothetical protein